MKRIDDPRKHKKTGWRRNTSEWEIAEGVRVHIRYSMTNRFGEWDVHLTADGIIVGLIGSWWKDEDKWGNDIFKTRLRGDGVHDLEHEIMFESKKKEDMITAIFQRWNDKELYKRSPEGLADVARRKELEDELHKNEDEHKVILGKIYAVDNKMRNI